MVIINKNDLKGLSRWKELVPSLSKFAGIVGAVNRTINKKQLSC
jgi:hypothetical protein